MVYNTLDREITKTIVNFITTYDVTNGIILLLMAYTFREYREFVFIIIACSQKRFDLKIVFVYLHITPSHYHHCASLSEDIELIKCLSDIVWRVCE